MKLVKQVHDDGCFIACVGTLLNKSYWQAFDLIHPGVRAGKEIPYGFKVGMSPPDAINKLVNFIDLRPTTVRRISQLRRNALLLIRWACAPQLQHAVVWDHKKRKIIDPVPTLTKRHYLYESQLDWVLYVGEKKI